MIYNNIESLIGNTPIIKLSSELAGLKNTDLYAKLEYLNPFGSTKDRTALGILGKDTDLKDKVVIESSSGNTAKALQVLSSRRQSRLITVTNRVKIPEIENLLKFMGAEIIQLPGRSECPDPNDKDSALNVIDKMMFESPEKFVHTSQYSNLNNTFIHQDTTAREVFTDIPDLDYFIGGVGTAGSSGGVIEYIKKHRLSTKVIGVVADPDDFLPGIRTMAELYETNLFYKKDYDQFQEVNSLDALSSLRILVKDEGVLAGPTTGANYYAAVEFLKKFDKLKPNGERQTAMIIACDRIESYMSYITARIPELFGKKNRTDIFRINKAIDKSEIEKSADQKTVDWLEGGSVQVIDIRGVKPHSLFRIKGSICYPEDYLREILQTGTPISGDVLFVCPTGEKSLTYASILKDRGVNSYSLKGGLLAWRAANLELERGL
jgi:cysteine synthase B